MDFRRVSLKSFDLFRDKFGRRGSGSVPLWLADQFPKSQVDVVELEVRAERRGEKIGGHGGGAPVKRLLVYKPWTGQLVYANAAHRDAGTFHVFFGLPMLLVGLGMGGVMLTFVLTCRLSAHYVAHVAWVGYGDGWGDVNVLVNLHAFCKLRRSRRLGWVWRWVGWC